MSKNTDNRNYGIDLLRIVAAFMIVVLHCYTRGSLFNYVIPGSKQDILCVVMMTLTYGGVNIFALISGYVSFYKKDKRVSYSKFIELWITVVFYCIILNLLLGGFVQNYSFLHELPVMLTPVSSNTYWYFSSYAGLMVLKPFIDKGLSGCSDIVLKKVFLVILIVYSLYSVFFNVFILNDGYSVLWLILLYVIGYIINRCKLFNDTKTVILLIYYVLLVAISVLLNFIIQNKETVLVIFDRDMFMKYHSPTILLISVFTVIVFSRIKTKELFNKIIIMVAPTAFSIYIVNCFPLFFENILKDMFRQYCQSDNFIIIGKVLIFSISFMFFVIIFDLLRIRIFKICKVDKLCIIIDNTLRKIMDKMVRFI